MGDGSPEAPLKTLSKALEAAAKIDKPVYACAEIFAEAVEVPAGAVLYGGLDCTGDWSSRGGSMKTTLSPPPSDPMALLPADVIGLRLRGASGKSPTRIEDVEVIAGDATLPGGSSIAALAEAEANVKLVRCELTAGRGVAGDKGATPTESVGPTDPTDPAIRGQVGNKACSGNAMTGNPGGSGATNLLCLTSIGGIGGTGKEANGEDGTDGQPVGTLGQHGTGQPNSGAWSCGVGTGQSGDNGTEGMPGEGARGDGSKGLLSAQGYMGVAGQPGEPGTPGQGGGGGGAAKGKSGCNGASGGGGGAGGCGGLGGLGGQPGGSSIALVSLGASFLFTNVELISGQAGDGGEGGDGQGGGIGGDGGAGGLGDSTAPSTLKACNGGGGGQGGSGGKGGGGRGGHSVGIAYVGTLPSLDGVTITTPSAAGMGGLGADDTGNGEPGVADQTLQLALAP
jgi:hypothetical protein